MDNLEREVLLNNVNYKLTGMNKVPAPVRDALFTLLMFLIEFLYKYFMERAGKRKSMVSIARALVSKEFYTDLGKLDEKLQNTLNEMK